LRFMIGFKNWSWYDYPTDEQFELMGPKEIQLGVVGEDGLLYLAYYDFETDTWMIDENTIPVDTWSEKEIAKKISRPAEGHHVVTTDEDDRFGFVSYGVTTDDYSQYVKSIKAVGFAEDNSNPSHFAGKSADGYTVKLWYYSEDERLSITIEKES